MIASHCMAVRRFFFSRISGVIGSVSLYYHYPV